MNVVGQGRQLDQSLTHRANHNCKPSCADPESVFRGDPTLTTFFKWRFAGGPMMVIHLILACFEIFQGIRTSIAKKHYMFVVLQEGSGPPAPPPL